MTSLRAAAVLAVAAGCIALLGAWPGALVAVLVAPVAHRLATVLHRRTPPRPVDRSLALALDLLAAALRAGQPVPDALVLAAPAAPPDVGARLAQVAGLLRLGADPSEAWGSLTADPRLEPLVHVARRSASSGIRLAASFERFAADIRLDCGSRAEARAHRAGVLAVAPLGLCFLPAFLCLGVVPVIAGVAGGALATLS